MLWLQAARSTAPREVADEVRLQEKRKRDKQVREEASMKAKVQKEREKRDVVWRVEQWKDRKLVSVEDVIETEEDGEDEDSEWDEEEQVKPIPFCSRRKADCSVHGWRVHLPCTGHGLGK